MALQITVQRPQEAHPDVEPGESRAPQALLRSRRVVVHAARQRGEVDARLEEQGALTAHAHFSCHVQSFTPFGVIFVACGGCVASKSK